MIKKTILFFLFNFFILVNIFPIITTENNNSKDENIIIKETPTQIEKILENEKGVTSTVETDRAEKSTPQIKEKTIKAKTEEKKKVGTSEINKGKEDKIKSLLENLKNAQKERMALKSKIKMITSYIDMETKQEIKGEVMIKKPDKFLVHYKEPTEQILISNGKILWVYTPELKQVIKQDIKQANLNMHFYIEFETSIDYFAKNSKNTLSENENQYIIKMVPKKGRTIGFDEIIAKINKKTLLPEIMSMKFEKTIVEVIFYDTETFKKNEIENNTEFSDKKFEFKKPEGVEEIETTSLFNVE